MPPAQPHHQRYVSGWFEEATTSHCQFWLVYRFLITLSSFVFAILLYSLQNIAFR